MLVITVQFDIHPTHASDFARRMLRQAEDSLANEPGCRTFDVCRDPARAGRFFLYEVYDDEAAFTAHLESDHFRAFDAAVRDWTAGKQVTTYERLRPAQ